MSLPTNKLIDSRYVINKLIAIGGMAEIYEANDTFYHRPVSIKLLKESSTSKKDIEQFKNEINFASAFNNPHIYKIYNVGEYENRPFMIYEQMKGKTLKDVLDERGHLTSNESIKIMLQIIDGVKDAHSRDITHNDLKPDNILILHDGTIKIVDFGIATHTYDAKFDVLLASAQYVAPEVIQEKHYTKQSDIYSLGIIIFEFITGKTPFMKKTAQEEIKAHIYEEIPSIKIYSNVPNVEELDFVIHKATNKKISDRYKNVSELEADLIKIKNGGKVRKYSIFERIFKK